MSDDWIADALAALSASLTPIHPTDTITQAGRKLVRADAIRLLALEDGVRLSDDIEFIHDMRVVTRRMRSVLRLLKPYYHGKQVRHLLKSLRWLARLLGDVRDLDVLLHELHTRDPIGLQHPITVANLARERAHRDLCDALDSETFHDLADQLTAFALKTKDPLAESAPLPVEVRHVVPVLIHQALSYVRAFDPLLDADTIPGFETLHGLRIAFKQLRYITAYFKDVLGSTADAFITELKAVQDHLGRMNDAVVFAGYLAAYSTENPADGTIADAVVALRAEADMLARTFLPVWQRFNSRAVQRALADALLVLR